MTKDKMVYDDGEKKHVAVPSLEQRLDRVVFWMKVCALLVAVALLVFVLAYYQMDRHNILNQIKRGMEMCNYAWNACRECG